ncbi:SPOR domain-containing protein [soil metagenome]
MTIATHISDLLYRYECVILPGFGAFLTQKESAHYNEKSQEFYPPQKRISFNSQLKKSDGLLANYVANVRKIKYAEAVYAISEYVGKLNLQLEKKQPVNLDNLGSFSISAEGKLQFEPVKEHYYLTEAFGLAKVQASVIKREVYKKQVQDLEEKAPILFTPERRRTTPVWKYAAIGLIALGISGFAGLNIYSGQIAEHNVAEQKEAQSQLQQQIQQATFIIDNPLPEITFKVSKQTGNYHIVAGAFRVEENAHQKVEELREEGFKARYIGENKFGLHQVVYGSFPTKPEAMEMLWKAKRTNEGAWMLIQEL